MATEEPSSRTHDRNGRRHPFSNWVKRLTNLKSSSNNSGHSSQPGKRHGAPSKNKKGPNHPYPLSGEDEGAGEGQGNGHLSFSEPARQEELSQSEASISESRYEDQNPPGRKSATPTMSIGDETTTSEAAHSKAGTAATVGGTHGGGEGSTFSSPSPSVRSLTTMTTVQSAAPSNQIYATHNPNQQTIHSSGSPYVTSSSSSQQQTGVQFSHQFPTTPPVSAVPPHITSSQPTTYSSATANNLLTDNASMLTLASSSKRRRRNSLDTNASVRALAPSSLFSGSRESLPLSVLSGTPGNVGTPAGAEPSNASVPNSSGVLNRGGIGGGGNLERSSVHSAADRGSIRSGRVSQHARNDSTTGGVPITGRMSRRSSGWGEITGEHEDEDEEDDSRQQPQQQKIEVTTTQYLDDSRSINEPGKGKEPEA